jgi:hypothetical protein
MSTVSARSSSDRGPRRGDLEQEPIASLATGLLQRSALEARQAGDIGAADVDREAEAMNRIGDGLRIGVAAITERVVEVGDGEPPASPPGGHKVRGSVQERHRIGSPRHGQHDLEVVAKPDPARAEVEAAGKIGEGGGSGGRIRTTGQGLMSPLLYH